MGRALSAPLFLARPLPDGPRATLDGPAGRHAAAVLRLRPGEPVDLTDGRGGVLHARVVGTGRDSLELDVEERATVPAPRPRLVVMQAPPKGERAEWAVGMLTEAGADEIVPWAADRAVVQWRGDRAERALARWRSAAAAAAQQARRAWWPEVGEPLDTPAVAARLAAAALAVPLDPAADSPLAGVHPPADGEIVLVVGPEGGLSPREHAAFGPGYRLGPEILRTSTAGAVAAGVLLARTNRWAATTRPTRRPERPGGGARLP